MPSPAVVVAETDCCGNLYPVHVCPPSPRRETGKPSLAATAAALAARLVWTLVLGDRFP